MMTVRGDDERTIAPGTDPSWAPDESRILFKTWVTGETRWHVATVRPDGSGVRRLTPGMHPAWSPDGRQIAYMTETVDGGTDIWIMTEDGPDRRCLTCRQLP
jgi:Tol biopolymer transport system component